MNIKKLFKHSCKNYKTTLSLYIVRDKDTYTLEPKIVWFRCEKCNNVWYEGV